MDLATVAARPSSNSGAHRRHYPSAPAVCYKECMRNHAAGIGGHALDGCCEFMPSTATNSGDPTSLICAACGCHRNFHRRDPDDPAPLQLFRHRNTVHRHRAPPPAATSLFTGPHMSNNGLSDSTPAVAPAAASPANQGGKLAGGGRKRFRTKFSHDQKEKMYEFAERLGWKLQRVDKTMVEDFCSEIGVGKEVLKVWMHNNKNTLGRREAVNGGTVAGDNGGQVDGAGKDNDGDFANGSSSSG